MKLQVKSASFSTDKGQKSRFSCSYRIYNNKTFIPKYLDNALKVLLKLHEHRGDRIGEKSSCERFCKVPVPGIIAEVKSVMGGGSHFIAMTNPMSLQP